MAARVSSACDSLLSVPAHYIDVNILELNSRMRYDGGRDAGKCKTRPGCMSGWCSGRRFAPWRLTPGSISVAVDRLEKTALVKRKNTDDRRVRLVELTPKGRALITKTFREHAAAMEEAAGVLSKEERRMLLRLLKKLGKGGDDEGR